MAPFGHAEAVVTCPLLGDDRTSPQLVLRSVFGPIAEVVGFVLWPLLNAPTRKIERRSSALTSSALKSPNAARLLQAAEASTWLKTDHHLMSAGAARSAASIQ